MKNVIKYTSDGKKVAVIGELNDKQSIVQEIFISNDVELPSGKNFVVDSLHDAPVQSWKERNIKTIEEKHDKIKAQCAANIKKYEKAYQEQRNSLIAKTDYLKKFISNATKESFDLLESFLKGEITHVLKLGYNCRIEAYKDYMGEYDGKSLKLLMFCGKDDGTLSFGINRYSDGSGSWEEHHLFTNEEDAISKFKEYVESKEYISEHLISVAKKYGFTLDQEAFDKYKRDQIESYEKRITTSKNDVQKLKAKLKELKKL